jgi:hypothetical protein
MLGPSRVCSDIAGTKKSTNTNLLVLVLMMASRRRTSTGLAHHGKGLPVQHVMCVSSPLRHRWISGTLYIQRCRRMPLDRGRVSINTCTYRDRRTSPIMLLSNLTVLASFHSWPVWCQPKMPPSGPMTSTCSTP